MNKKQRIRNAIQEQIGGVRIQKLEPGEAFGATKNGSICAASFGASALGKAQQRANFLKTKKQAQLRSMEAQRPRKNSATAKQRLFAKDLGTPLPKECTIAEAKKLIARTLNRRKSGKKVKRK